MYRVLNTEAIPGGCGVTIEFGVPYTSSRIDFLLTGRQNGDRDAAVIVNRGRLAGRRAAGGEREAAEENGDDEGDHGLAHGAFRHRSTRSMRQT